MNSEWKVPFYRSNWGGKEERAVLKVMRSYKLVKGPVYEEFSAKFSRFIGSRFSLPVNSCTSALELAFQSLPKNGRDLVICPAYTHPATINAVINSGYKPVIVDVRKHSLDMDWRKAPINKNVFAIIPVYFSESLEGMEDLLDLCKSEGVYMVSDCAQAAGASYQFKCEEKKLGSFEDISCFSFFPTKNMSTGEGGILVTNSENIYEKASILSSHGIVSKGQERVCVFPGHNYRMTDILAAIGSVQIDKLEELNEQRICAARRYEKRLSEVVGVRVLHNWSDWRNKRVYQVFMIEISSLDRNFLLRRLREDYGVECLIHYHPSIPEMGIYKSYLYSSCENAIEHSNKCLSLPMHSRIKNREIDFVCDKIEEILSDKYIGFGSS